MLRNNLTTRLLLVGFMILVGFSLAKSLYVGSVTGIILAITSLGAGTYFIYLFLNLQRAPSSGSQEDEYPGY